MIQVVVMGEVFQKVDKQIKKEDLVKAGTEVMKREVET
jgi:hypothetical protein